MLCDFNWNEKCSKITEEEYKKDKDENWYYPNYYSKCNDCEVRKKYCSCKHISNNCRACQESANSNF